MSLISTDPSSPVTKSAQLKFTLAELDYLQSYLDRKDRGG